LGRWAVAAVAATALAVVGCGESEGVDRNATLNVYVSAPLCAGAEGELAREGARVASVHLRIVCLDSVQDGGRLDLATLGANARRTVEDSSSIAYIGDPNPAETRFSRPILETAGIPRLANQSGGVAMTKLLRALRGAGDSSPLREAVADELPES
jgi:hypothetical protein